ncbi:DUF1566 domain-containing protein, partial [Vibrio cholerae]|nr:DUF1566 domain-containing protein [Vibrio cholerae]EGR5456887.1 DUF1566 domain-containing protein [Vibrio cholerae]EGR5464520.1 DUF1566 domain-containing protein [Vibrio cholerae]
ENGTYGPAGFFYVFNNKAKADALCDAYKSHRIGGRTNWRLATKDELKTELYDASGNMFTARGWPNYSYYWSATPDGSNYYVVSLYDGNVNSSYLGITLYASCVSNP